MMVHDSFDHRPDPVIGRLLREHLSTDDDAAFVARVRRAVHGPARWQGPASGEWDLLAGWFKPGLAAAAAVLVAALVGVVVEDSGSALRSLAETLGPAEAPAELLAADAHPDPQVLVSPLLEAR